jgi:hypothetical protein
MTTIIGGIITSDQRADIRNSGYAPGSNPLDSAIIADLPTGNYTAIVRGVNNLTGVALVEVYVIDEIITTDDADNDELENGSPLTAKMPGRSEPKAPQRSKRER